MSSHWAISDCVKQNDAAAYDQNNADEITSPMTCRDRFFDKDKDGKADDPVKVHDATEKQ